MDNRKNLPVHKTLSIANAQNRILEIYRKEVALSSTESKAVNVAAFTALRSALNVSFPDVQAANVESTTVVSELVKPSQKPIVFNELRVVLGYLFGLTHPPPNCKKYALPGFAIGAVFA